MKHRYKYEGPVLVNSNVTAINWKGEAVADNKDIARLKIADVFKKEAKLKGKPRIYLPKEIKEMEAVL